MGEIAAAAPLIRSLRERNPSLPILVTTHTLTGAQSARRLLPEDVRHGYLPWDWPGAVTRFLNSTRPRAALIMETELWPNLFAACAHHGIPPVIVNARLSDRTLRAGVFRRGLLRGTLSHARAFLARSDTDREGFVSLGADPARTQTVGNIKFATTTVRPGEPQIERAYVLTASTHEDEEIRIALTWNEMEHKDRLLVIVPRHPERGDEITKQLRAKGLRVSQRSRQEAISAETQVYVADTVGELITLMAYAEVIFMGGSLIPRGGHNLLEPARLARPILFGPHMENFAEEARLLLEEQAAVQVSDELALVKQMIELLGMQDRRQALGRRALAVVERQFKIAERYADELESLGVLEPV